MTEPVIQRGVPIPVQPKHIGITKALKALEPGDSFLVPLSWKIESVKSCAYSMRDRQFTIRQAHPEGLAYRVWRVS